MKIFHKIQGSNRTHRKGRAGRGTRIRAPYTGVPLHNRSEANTQTERYLLTETDFPRIPFGAAVLPSKSRQVREFDRDPALAALHARRAQVAAEHYSESSVSTKHAGAGDIPIPKVASNPKTPHRYHRATIHPVLGRGDDTGDEWTQHPGVERHSPLRSQ